MKIRKNKYCQTWTKYKSILTEIYQNLIKFNDEHFSSET